MSQVFENNRSQIFNFSIRQAQDRQFSIFNNTGFSLIELLVVIAMLAVLFLALLTTFNPLSQFNKAKDSQRQHDIAQIQRALDSYFNDTGCYPTSLTFGSIWKVNTQIYMEKVPQDPDCTNNPSQCYAYEVPPDNCPQWNVLYAALRSTAVPANACPLAVRNTATACLPSGYTANNYNYCLASGSIDCSTISASTIGSNGNGGGGGGGGGGGSTATPTSIPSPTSPVCPGNNYYACTGDNRCNSIFPYQNVCIGFGGHLQCYCDRHCNQSCAFN